MMKRHKPYKVIFRHAVCLTLAGILCFSQPLAAAATNTAQAEQEKKEAQKKLDEANRKAQEAESKINAAESAVMDLTAELTDLLSEIKLLEADISDKDAQIRQAQVDYDAAREKEQRQYEAMKKRIKYMYEKGDTEYLDVLLKVKSMSELLNKSEYIEDIYTYDRNMLTEYQNTKLAVKQYKDDLENDKAEMEVMQLEYKEQQTNLETTIAKKRAEIANFDEQLEIAMQDAANYAETIAQKNAQIRQAEAEQRRREEEARKKAEEEQKKREEESRLLAQSQTTSAAPEETAGITIAANTSSDTALGSGTTKTTAPSTAADPDVGPNVSGNPGGGTTTSSGTSNSSGPGETQPAKSSSSSKGQSVVNYALQFVGNPYVYGGTSLTEGADCSGFVQSVYKHFGVSLPRTSSEQRSAGTGVDYASAQPGDLICYAGHVAIYMGNGQIVHASTPTTGIKVGNATYRTILSVRRVLK